MLSPRKHPIFAFLVIAADAISVVASFVTAYWFRFSGVFIQPEKGIPSIENYLRIMIIVVPIYLLVFRLYRLYQPDRNIRRIQELLNVVKAISVATVVFMALTFIYREFSYSRLVLFSTWFFSILYCSLTRYFLIQFEYLIRRKDKDRVLIIGMNQNTQDLILWAKRNPHYGEEVVGILTSESSSQEKYFKGVPILGTYKDFDQIASQYKVNETIVADTTIERQLMTELMLKSESKLIGFKLAADFFGIITHYVDLEYISNVPLLGLKALPLEDPWNRAYKRLFDFCISLILIVLCSPILIVITLIIKAANHGPIFYAQERMGRDGKCFMLYKFRTMVVNAEQATGPVWTQKNDERITPFGQFLRRFNLDELPQLWNILIGNMSLVGPRPERPHFVEKFKDQIPHYMTRHKIKSGLTGWAQIHGLRGNTSLEERIKYDLYYLGNWTPMLDLEILIVTVFAFKNAY